MTPLRRLASVTAILALALALAAPATAAPSSADARRRQQQVKAERGRKAAQLNALKASDDELEKGVKALAVQVNSQRGRVSAAKQAANAADAAVKQADAKLAAIEAQTTTLQAAVKNRAIKAYIRPEQSALAGLSGATSLEDASRRRSMLQQVANNDRDIIDELRALKEDSVVEREKADSARSIAAKRKEAARQHLATLEQNLVEKAKLEHALDARIKSITGESEALAREDASIQELINRQSRADRASRSGDSADAGGRVSGAGLRWPVSGPVTSEFGYRWGRLHAGIDIGAGSGTPIRAAKSGGVIFAGSQGGYGNVVIIDHGGGLSTLYAHQSRIAARDGDEVAGGEVIGYVGSTGHSTGPHLHFETRVGGSPQNPRRYL